MSLSRAEPAIVILGAGPTGLGAAWRLDALGSTSWTLLEASDTPGGLSASVVDPTGFTWDLGGHVLHSHYDVFDRLMEDLLPGGWIEHTRASWVWMSGCWIPYPLQNNIGSLPPERISACIRGLVDARESHGPAPADFAEWLLATFGRGLCDLFLFPYNRKVWGYEPSRLDVGWMADRVAPVELSRVLENALGHHVDRAWGPNRRFRFPSVGGTGAIWRALANRLPEERLRYRKRVVGIDADRRMVLCDDGEVFAYDRLISSIPLDQLLTILYRRPDLSARARELIFSSTHVVGVGVEGTLPPELFGKNWVYFPEPDLPFYRVTVFSSYAPANVPDPSRYWSLLCEAAESSERPVDSSTVANQVVLGLQREGLLPNPAPIASLWHRRLPRGYPTPFLGRDAVLHPIDAELRSLGIFSRGRFGGWKYEVSNQDHSLMQGVEAVDHMLLGHDEVTYFHPSIVNAARAS
jgi:protoporphyrinogen oxidase